MSITRLNSAVVAGIRTKNSTLELIKFKTAQRAESTSISSVGKNRDTIKIGFYSRWIVTNCVIGYHRDEDIHNRTFYQLMRFTCEIFVLCHQTLTRSSPNLTIDSTPQLEEHIDPYKWLEHVYARQREQGQRITAAPRRGPLNRPPIMLSPTLNRSKDGSTPQIW